MDRSDWWGAKGSKKVSRILLEQMKTWKFKQIQRQIIIANGFQLNHSFVQIQKKREENDIHNPNEITITQRSTPSKHKATWIPNSAAKPWSFLSQKCRDRMYNDMPKQSQVSNIENDLEITWYRLTQPIPLPLGVELIILGVFSTNSKQSTKI